MFGVFFRGFASWVASNWAGLAAGYAISDVAGNLAPPKYEEAPEPKSRIVRAMQSVFGTSLPVWLYGLITAFLLFYVYRIIQKRSK
jgi:hypothetical protein